jgi:thymidine phosphorylase
MVINADHEAAEAECERLLEEVDELKEAIKERDARIVALEEMGAAAVLQHAIDYGRGLGGTAITLDELEALARQPETYDVGRLL